MRRAASRFVTASPCSPRCTATSASPIPPAYRTLGSSLRAILLDEWLGVGMLLYAAVAGAVVAIERIPRWRAGWYLTVDRDGERFMHKYDPRNERATRDIVSRGMYQEMREGKLSPNGGLYISMGHLGPENVRKEFKGDWTVYRPAMVVVRTRVSSKATAWSTS
mgnify:CR=1 FL=1